MDDNDLHRRINALVDEEHELEKGHVSEEDRARLRAIEVALDQCWDLLRQRKARQEFALDPDGASVRPAGVVEGYQQ